MGSNILHILYNVQNVSYSEILLSNKKEWAPDSHNMDETQKHYVVRENTQEYILCDSMSTKLRTEKKKKLICNTRDQKSDSLGSDEMTDWAFFGEGNGL